MLQKDKKFVQKESSSSSTYTSQKEVKQKTTKAVWQSDLFVRE